MAVDIILAVGCCILEHMTSTHHGRDGVPSNSDVLLGEPGCIGTKSGKTENLFLDLAEIAGEIRRLGNRLHTVATGLSHTCNRYS